LKRFNLVSLVSFTQGTKMILKLAVVSC